MGVLITCKYDEDLIKMKALWELSVAMDTSSHPVWPKT